MKTGSSRTEKKRRNKMMGEVDELTCLLGNKQQTTKTLRISRMSNWTNVCGVVIYSTGSVSVNGFDAATEGASTSTLGLLEFSTGHCVLKCRNVCINEKD